MKTIHQIRKEIDSILALDRREMKKREHSKHSKRLVFLNTCLNYIYSEPTKEFLLKESGRIELRIQLIYDDFTKWISQDDYETEKKRLEDYEKLNGIKELKTQLKTLNYLLS